MSGPHGRNPVGLSSRSRLAAGVRKRTNQVAHEDRGLPSLGSPVGPDMSRHELHDYPGQLLALVLLEEVPSAGNRRVGLVFCAWNLRLKQPLCAAGDGIGIAEGREERLRPLAQSLPGAPVGLRGGVVRRSRDEKGGTGERPPCTSRRGRARRRRRCFRGAGLSRSRH